MGYRLPETSFSPTRLEMVTETFMKREPSGMVFGRMLSWVPMGR